MLHMPAGETETQRLYKEKDWQGIMGEGEKTGQCDQLIQSVWAESRAGTTTFLNWYRHDFLPTLLDQLITVASILRVTTLFYGYLCCL